VVYKTRWVSRGIQPLASCPSFGASWGSDSPCLLGNTLQSLPLTLVNVVSGLVLSSSLERVPRGIVHRFHAYFMHTFSPQPMMVRRNMACRNVLFLDRFYFLDRTLVINDRKTFLYFLDRTLVINGSDSRRYFSKSFFLFLINIPTFSRCSPLKGCRHFPLSSLTSLRSNM
jgi:hypothetical protein